MRPHILSMAICCLAGGVFAQDFDIAILNGRVMDPETGFDQVSNVGIKDGKIAVITDNAISAAETIDATGHVVSLGFVDFHSHAQSPYGFRLFARDGVTTPLDLELGAYSVNDFYDYWKAEGALLNYGTNVGHAFARVAVLDGVDLGGRAAYGTALVEAMNDGAKFKTKLYDPLDAVDVTEAVEEGLKQGGLGIAFPIGYYSVTGSPEVLAVAGLAHEYGVPITAHVRYLSQIPPSGFLGMQEMLNVAQTHNVPLLLHHVPSNCLGLTANCLDLIESAQSNGMNVIGEFYPYTFAGTYVDADYLKPGYKENLGIEASDIAVTETGDRLTDEEFDRLRTEAPTTALLMYTMKEEYFMEAFSRSSTIIGSDGMPWLFDDGYGAGWEKPYGAGNGHPRGAGAHAKVLRLARENDDISLMDALSKMTYLPVKFLGTTVPQMRTRGRMQEGMNADITIFNPETVTDNSTWEIGKNSLPSTGIPYVLVNGVVVVKESVVQRVIAGSPIRNAEQ